MKQTEDEPVRYKKFNHARLEDDLIIWLKEEKNKYKTWNLFFRELKKRYVDGKTGVGREKRSRIKMFDCAL